MLRGALLKVISVTSLAASVIALPAVGNAGNLVLSDAALDQVTAGYNLTGTWRGSDGVTYYVREIADLIYWYGEGVSCCSNVAYGNILGSTANVTFAGVPKKSDFGAGGLALQISSDNFMFTTRKTVTAGAVFGGTFDSTTFSK